MNRKRVTIRKRPVTQYSDAQFDKGYQQGVNDFQSSLLDKYEELDRVNRRQRAQIRELQKEIDELKHTRHIRHSVSENLTDTHQSTRHDNTGSSAALARRKRKIDG